MAFTTTVGAGGTSLIGTSGVDTTAFAPGTLATAVFIGAQGDADIVNLQSNQANSYTIQMGSGNDTINAAGLRNSTVKGDDGNDTIAITGTIQASTVSGLNGIDTITVANVNGALVNGNNDADTMTINGTLSNNGLFVGGQAGDTITVAAGATLTSGRVNGQDGADTITVGALAAGMASTGATINGGQGSDFINAGGAGTNVVLSGDLGNDTVTGGTGADTIYGGDGDDRITGGLTSADSMIGGSGSDTFVQGANTSLTGAQTAAAANWAANDTVTFANGLDIITDFTTGTGGDVINGIGGATPTAIFGTANGIGNALTATTAYYLSGNYSGTTFTVTANGAGADTLIVFGSAGTVAAGTGDILLQGVNSSTLAAANFS